MPFSNFSRAPGNSFPLFSHRPILERSMAGAISLWEVASVLPIARWRLNGGKQHGDRRQKGVNRNVTFRHSAVVRNVGPPLFARLVDES